MHMRRLQQIPLVINRQYLQSVASQNMSSYSVVETSRKIEVGSRVEINVRNKWYIGTALRKIGSDFIVRLDKLPFAKYEKRISPKNENIRLAVVTQTEKTTSKMSEREEQIGSNLRSMILFTMPSTWPMERDYIQSLTNDQLASFPMDDFLQAIQAQVQNQVLAWAKIGSGG